MYKLAIFSLSVALLCSCARKVDSASGGKSAAPANGGGKSAPATVRTDVHLYPVLVDGKWGYVGSANFDNCSLHLNFEAGCILHTPALIEEVAKQFEADLADATLFDAAEINAMFTATVNFNRPAERWAARFGKPLVGNG